MTEIDWWLKRFALCAGLFFADMGFVAGVSIADQPESNKGPAHQLLPAPTKSYPSPASLLVPPSMTSTPQVQTKFPRSEFVVATGEQYWLACKGELKGLGFHLKTIYMSLRGQKNSSC
jgi:hypothetical protein